MILTSLALSVLAPLAHAEVYTLPFNVELSPSSYIVFGNGTGSYTNNTPSVQTRPLDVGDMVVVPLGATNSTVRLDVSHVVDITPASRVYARTKSTTNADLDQAYLELGAGKVHAHLSPLSGKVSGDVIGKKIIIRTSGATAAVRGSDMIVDAAFTRMTVTNRSPILADVVTVRVDGQTPREIYQGKPQAFLYPVPVE